eukprot:1188409-Prorocentrum_minimum.AAC.1
MFDLGKRTKSSRTLMRRLAPVTAAAALRMRGFLSRRSGWKVVSPPAGRLFFFTFPEPGRLSGAFGLIATFSLNSPVHTIRVVRACSEWREGGPRARLCSHVHTPNWETHLGGRRFCTADRPDGQWRH